MLRRDEKRKKQARDVVQTLSNKWKFDSSTVVVVVVVSKVIILLSYHINLSTISTAEICCRQRCMKMLFR
jgi:hypothetical protein